MRLQRRYVLDARFSRSLAGIPAGRPAIPVSKPEDGVVAHGVEFLIDDFVIDNVRDDPLSIDAPSRGDAEALDGFAGLDKNAVRDLSPVFAATDGVAPVRVGMANVQILHADKMKAEWIQVEIDQHGGVPGQYHRPDMNKHFVLVENSSDVRDDSTHASEAKLLSAPTNKNVAGRVGTLRNNAPIFSQSAADQRHGCGQ
jgi:hypothetical protein